MLGCEKTPPRMPIVAKLKVFSVEIPDPTHAVVIRKTPPPKYIPVNQHSNRKSTI